MKRAITGIVVVLCFAIFHPFAAGQPSKLSLRRLAARLIVKSLRIEGLGLRYLALGKEALLAKNVPGAHAWFLLARPRLGAQQAEANFYVAVTRLLLLPMQEQPIAARLGFQGPGKTPVRQDHLNPLAFTAVPPRQASLPTELVRGSDWQELLASDALPALEESLVELNRMPTGFASFLQAPNPLTNAKGIEIDDADVALLRAGLHLALAQVHLAQLYNVDVDISKTINDLKGRATGRVVPGVLQRNPSALRITDARQAAVAKTELILAINEYLAAESLMSAEKDDQRDDLFSYSLRPQDVKKAQAFKQALGDLKKSLQGMPDPLWTLTIDQALDLGRFFDRPIDLRALGTGRGIQQGLLVEHLLYQTQYALANLKKVPPTFSQKIDPERVFDLDHARRREIEVDYGDALLLQAALESAHAAIAVVASLNTEIDLEALAPQAVKPAFDLNTEALGRYPLLLRVQDRSRLGEAKIATQAAVQAALGASTYLRTLDDRTQSDDLFPYQGDLVPQEIDWRRSLLELHAGLKTTFNPHPTRGGQSFLVPIDLNPVFEGRRDPRDLLPKFQGVIPLPNTLPDPTLGGITPTLTQSVWTERVWPDSLKRRLNPVPVAAPNPNPVPKPAENTTPSSGNRSIKPQSVRRRTSWPRLF